jgi:hypothetical protein
VAAAVTPRALSLALAAIGIAILLQLFPLPIGLHARLSPAAAALLPDLDFAYASGEKAYRELSIVPSSTWTALALFGSFALLLLGASRLLATSGSRQVAQGLAVIGVVVAFAGIIQKPLYDGAIYGFWVPEQPRVEPFGPFVNKNHFAGWILLALPVVLALVCAGIQRSMQGLKPGWRYRVLWLSSPEASRLILLAAGAGVMGLALVLTMSRSGISALMLALLLTGWFVIRGVRDRSRKAAGAAYLLLLAVTLVAWIGADTIVTRFSKVNWSEFNNRRGIWVETWSIASAFPLTGSGINSSDTLGTYYQKPESRVRVGEAHNDYLQLAAEGGSLVGVPILVCLVIFVREVRRRALSDEPGSTSWWVRRGAITALVAIALQETVEFSLQMPGNAALFAIICAFAIHRPQLRAPVESVRPRPVGEVTAFRTPRAEVC